MFVRQRRISLLFVAAVLLASTIVLPAHAFTGAFSDDDGSVHESSIDSIAAAGITEGCGVEVFCPSVLVTRAQMASFLSRALDLAPAATDWFSDDTGSVHEDAINRLATAGITSGFGDGTFRPTDPVRRDQMASFLARGLDLAHSDVDAFGDDEGSVHEAAINSVAAAGITLGCGNGEYCPADSVRRDQMASFLARALDLGDPKDDQPVGPPSPPPDATIDPVLVAERRIAWAPGASGGIQHAAPAADVVDFGAVGDGVSDDSAAFLAAIAASGPGAIDVPAGTYLLTETIDLGDGQVLRGAGVGATSLRFDLGGASANLVQIQTFGRGDWVNATGGLEIGSTTLTVSDSSGFTVGEFAEIQQDNDPAVMYTDPQWEQDWAEESVGQMLRVVGVADGSVTVDPPLHTTYDPDLNPVVRPQRLVVGAGVESLEIERLDTGIGATILLKNAADAFVRNVESAFTVTSHVEANSVLGCEVRDSHFHHSHDYGGGGRGYGVNLGRHVTACLIENNTFDTLRHAMLVQVGATGNVFGYNASTNPLSDGDWSPPDISLHGHAPEANLFEGNVVAEVGFSDFWGPLRPHNTLYRTCVYLEGVFILDHSHSQNLLGNVLIGDSAVVVDPSVVDTYRHGNFVGATLEWDPEVEAQELPDSLYRDSAPSFFGSDLWPPVGPEHDTRCTNPAAARLGFVPTGG